MILIVATFTFIRFIGKMDQLIPQSNLDWEHISYTSEGSIVTVDSVAQDYMRIEYTSFKFLPDYTYEMRQGNKNFYFNYTYYTQNAHGQGIFEGLRWLHAMPSKTGKQDYMLRQLNLDMKKQNAEDWVSFGDGFLIENEGKYFRILLYQNQKVNFVGDKKDVFNFEHMAYSGESVSAILEKSNNLPRVDTYVVGFKSTEEILAYGFTDFVMELVSRIREFNSEARILWLTYPCILSANLKSCSVYNYNLRTWDKVDIIVVDVDKIVRDSIYLLDDKNLNKAGIEKITREVINESVAK